MGGALQLTRALALEWARDGITANAIGVGWMSEDQKAADPQLLKYIPLKRYGNPGEIGPLLGYLASDAASFLTAEFIYVDGAVMDVL
jgi:gluconate 5-dehydrogenase